MAHHYGKNLKGAKRFSLAARRVPAIANLLTMSRAPECAEAIGQGFESSTASHKKLLVYALAHPRHLFVCIGGGKAWSLPNIAVSGVGNRIEKKGHSCNLVPLEDFCNLRVQNTHNAMILNNCRVDVGPCRGARAAFCEDWSS